MFQEAQLIKTATQLFRTSRNILFITGAGISADSGLPTYRGVGGLYDGRLTGDGVTIEEALSGEMFRSRPEITWRYLGEIGESVATHKPNSAHHFIANLEKRGTGVCVLTQNIDGYHTAAGSKNVIEIHGSLWRRRCGICGQTSDVEPTAGNPGTDTKQHCNRPMRPDVVLFGEMLPARAIDHFESELGRGFDLVVSIGTSSQFPYIVQPVLQAVRSGTPTIEINPSPTEMSRIVGLHLKMGAVEAFARIESEMRGDPD